LFTTQFAQAGILLAEKAKFEDMRSNGLINERAVFAGHSLGEYGALAALGEFIPFERLLDIIFYRGLAMQVAVERDAQGYTDYSMMAVNPSRIGPCKYLCPKTINYRSWANSLSQKFLEKQHCDGSSMLCRERAILFFKSSTSIATENNTSAQVR
jgi:Acyl transferase domain